jgi:hypothetical protein
MIVGPQASRLDPGIKGFARGRCDFELHRPVGLPLHDYGPRANPVAAAHVADAQVDEIAPAQLAVDAQIQQRKIPSASLQL